MKLKYYLRGLGTGIAVTALILGISTISSRKSVMTDEEVIARAKELGMVERTVLSETVTESAENEEEESEPEPESEPVESEPEAVEPESEPVESEPEAVESESEPVESEPEVVEPESEPEVVKPIEEAAVNPEFGMPDEVGTINIRIARGDSSVSVSKRLEEAGLIDSAVDYDRYLCQNGYDKKIQTGDYEIPANATQEEIAIMITSR